MMGRVKMKRAEELYVLRAFAMIVASWLLAIFLVHSTYPPRSMVVSEYVFVLLVGTSAILLCHPHVHWRFAVYYSLFAGMPALLRVAEIHIANFRLRIGIGHDPSIAVVLLPLGGVLLLLTTTAAAFASFGARCKSTMRRRRRSKRIDVKT